MININELMKKYFDVDEISDDLSPDNVPNWDSLNQLSFFVEIEKLAGKKLNMIEIMDVKNFKDIKVLLTNANIEFE